MPSELESSGHKLLLERYPATAGRPSFEIPTWVLRREVDRQMVLLNVESEQYFGLNEVGAHIVARVTEQPLDEAVADLMNDYEVDPEILLRDVHKVIDDLVREGLLARTASL